MRLFIQEEADDDLFRQIEWYAEKGLPDIARRFQRAALTAIDALLRRPMAGSPRLVNKTRLNGLRSWPVKDFANWRIYYLVEPDLLTVVRILHGKRDINSMLEE